MKTLVIQLARFGDIYQTWPTLHALIERDGQEVHLLVRERFKAATIGLPAKIRVHTLPTKEMLGPFYTSNDGVRECTSLSRWLKRLRSEEFDKVINLSFSPFSSYLTSYLEMAGAEVSGYSRHQDGYLNVTDDASAYFYGQVGVGRPNRIHLTQMFSMVAGVELDASHLHPSFSDSVRNDSFESEGDYFVLHVGASDLGKTMSESQLNSLVRNFLTARNENLVLVGVASEKKLAQAAKPLLGSERVIDLTGKTRLEELFPIIEKSIGLIGSDSAPIHIASLLNKPVLNIGNRFVNSYETGPFSDRFIVWDIEKNSEFSEDDLGKSLEQLVSKESIQHIPGVSELQDQQWKMLQTLYLGGEYPTRIPRSTAAHLTQLVDMLPAVYSATKDLQTQVEQNLLQVFEQTLQQIEKTDPLLSLVIRWFNTERIRIQPGSIQDVQEATLDVLNRLFLVLSDWVRILGEEVEFITEIESLSEHIEAMIKNFRFINLPPALEGLEKFLPLLNDPVSTEVQMKKLAKVKSDLEVALRISDFERIADILEYDVLTWKGDTSQSPLPTL